MKRFFHIILGMLLLTACYKDELDLEQLNNNPFDRDYVGPSVFELVGTYSATVTIQGVPTPIQVIEFRVREDLFLSPSSYSVHVLDKNSGSSEYLNQYQGTNIFKYGRAPEPGIPICLELRLANNLATAGANEICATL